MKRILLLSMCMILLCSFPVTAAAEESGIYETAGDLYEAWVSGDCVPDYITAVISTDGGTDNLTFGLVKGEAGEKGREEIIALVRDDSTVTIMYQTYSRNELYRIQDQIVDEYFGKDLGLVTAGVSEGANKLVLEVKKDYAENPPTLAMIEKVKEQYGDMVFFRFTDHEIHLVAGTEPNVVPPLLVMTNPQKQSMPYLFAFLFCVMMMAVLICLEMRRHRLIASTGNGAVILDSQSVGRREIEDTIRSTEVKPSAALQDRVMRSINDFPKDNS